MKTTRDSTAMKYFGGDEIREKFLEYFQSRGHHRIRGSSLLPENDPTLLFVNSGMAPLKPYFTGLKKPPAPDLCNVQPCIRTRDIDDVGDRHHLTFFEMLGSWSIGGYFKERAVELAYDLLADQFGFPKEKIFVSVYSGDPALGLEPDHETARAWERVGVPQDHIVYLGEDNFWGPAGETGPCGPCTEMFFDTGDAYGPPYRPGAEFDTKRRYIEVWNAGVFMQLNKKADGTFGRLPFNSVDTGSGLERMAMVLQGVQSVYETDLFSELMKAVKERASSSASEETCRIITDHVRAACFILSEGVSPGNEGRSYIPRRLIRKCVALVARAGVSAFDYAGLIDVIVRRFRSHYPLLVERREEMTSAFLRETHEFERVIGKGLERLEQLSNKPAPFTISGKDAFGLFATYGLPVEITREFVREKGGTVDDASYLTEFQRHQEISRATGKSANDAWTDDAEMVDELLHGRTSEFIGYEVTEADAKAVALVQNGHAIQEAAEGTRVEVLADKTPFYAEGGGQVGDRGEIRGEGGAVASVLDTHKVGATHVHRVEVLKGVLHAGESIHLAVDETRRRATMANHSATHLLHAALREVLGSHVRQAGSLVDPERLRFDFEHPKKVTPDQLQTIERRVNELVRQNNRRETAVTSYAKAVENGALAFFGEKYGDEVRMVRFGPASAELCGGTHVDATGEIGMFRIISESSVASGIRRIVALTGEAAVRYTQEQDHLLRELSAHLKVPQADFIKKLDQLINKGGSKRSVAGGAVARVGADDRATTLPNGLPFMAVRIDGSTEDLTSEALRVAADIGGVAVLVGEANGKASLVVAVAKDKSSHYSASRLMGLLTPYVDGKGGGSPHLARGGGNNPNGIQALISNAHTHAAAVAQST
jgi:alanyl-tRNA synthetase